MLQKDESRMGDTVGVNDWVRMLRTAAEKVSAATSLLTQLDSVIGDGDHGTTMSRAMALVVKAVAEVQGRDPKTLLTDVGWALMGVDGGASGPLLGTLMIGVAEGIGDRQVLDASALATAFESGLAALQKQSKAQVGDKTMMDALVPAVAALRAAADAGDDVGAAMAKVAAAAEQGAESTKPLRARFGRARNLGDRSIGSQDPGATSLSILIRGMAEALA